MEKTNVMRILDQKKIAYIAHEYLHDETPDGLMVAELLKKDPNCVFKTIVLVSPAKRNYVAMVPVNETIDLKKYAVAVNEKSVEPLPLKELTPLTGYVRGGCSPIGMKKTFRTVVHQQLELLDTIIFSAGRVGYQVELKPTDLPKALAFTVADIVK